MQLEFDDEEAIILLQGIECIHRCGTDLNCAQTLRLKILVVAFSEIVSDEFAAKLV